MNPTGLAKLSRQPPMPQWFRLAAEGWVGRLLAAGVPWVVYLRTLAPTVYGLDGAELSTGAYTLGIVHAPGEPTYLLIGHLFTRLPFGDVGYRLNLLSACAAAATALFVYLILWQLTEQGWIALLSAWFLAFTYYFWVSATWAKNYPLNACFVAALIWLGLEWRAHGGAWRLYLFAFLFGLGLGTHTMLILLTPGLAWLVLSAPSQPWRKPGQLALVALASLLGASVYLYLPLRYLANPTLNYARDYWGVNLASWDGFWWMVTGRMFGPLMFAISPETWAGELQLYLYRLWSNFIGLGLGLGLVGLVGTFRRGPAVHTALAIMFVGHLAFYIPYGAVDKDTMFLPTYLIWGLWVGLGCYVLWEQIQWRVRELAALVPTVLVLLVAYSLVLNWPLANQSQEWRAREWGTSILTTVEPNAFYFGTWADVPILEYLQQVEQQRRDVTTVNLFFTGPANGTRLALEKLRAGYAVYTSAPWLANEDLDLRRVDACECYSATLAIQIP